MNFHERKQERKDYYFKYIYGWVLEMCGACSGSGKYDHFKNGRIPNCGCCEGTGKIRKKGLKNVSNSN